MGGMMVSTLRTKRFLAQATIYDVYRDTGIQPSKISLIERGYVTAQPDEQKRLAEYFGCAVEELFNHSGQMLALQDAC